MINTANSSLAIDNNFTIRFSKKGNIFLLIFFCLIEIFLVWGYFYDRMHRVACIIMGTYSTFIFIFLGIGSILFKIRVHGNFFSVRTKIGKKFSFTCADIWKIHCTKTYHLKYGPQFYIVIYTRKNGRIEVHHDMDGFKQLAEYLLMQLNTGNIKEFAVSDTCRNELIRYKNGEIFLKKTKK